MTKPLLMLTMPNSGSTWLANAIGKSLPGCRYYEKEFFNPVCNMKHELVLRRQFGSELLDCYRNIATPGDATIHDDIRATWGAEKYTFTKECQSCFKLPVFLQHFKVFVFVRSAAESFPPRRARVWSFYEHAWWALKAQGHVLNAVSTPDRALEAHRILYDRLLSDAAAHDVPVIHYSELFTADPETLRATLAKCIGYDGPEVAYQVMQTRQQFSRG